jgi:hypothetical protein
VSRSLTQPSPKERAFNGMGYKLYNLKKFLSFGEGFRVRLMTQ